MALVSSLFGSFTTTPQVARSALFSQGQRGYPKPAKSARASASDLAEAPPGVDCRECARELLRSAGYRLARGEWRDHSGATLSVTLGVGPSAMDLETAALVASQWRQAGVHVEQRVATSDQEAGQWAARGLVDVALIGRPTGENPWVTARSFDGAPYVDAYPSGDYTSSTHALVLAAETDFNPTTADIEWAKVDDAVLVNFWARPLYTVPSLTLWSDLLARVVPSLSLAGLVDQVSGWGIAVPTTTTTTTTAGGVG